MDESDNKFCHDILDEIKKMPIAEIFMQPVKAPDYDEVVKRRMDFGKIRNKLNNNKYRKTSEFIDDVRQIYENSKAYNGEKNLITYMSEDIFREVTRQFSIRQERSNEDWYLQLGQVHARLNRLMQLVPDDFVNQKLRRDPPYPKINSEETQQKLDMACGEKEIKKVYENWNTFNGTTKERVIRALQKDIIIK